MQFFFKLEEKLILIEASINLITRNSYMLFYYIVPLSIEAQICMNSLFKNVGWRQFFFLFLNPR